MSADLGNLEKDMVPCVYFIRVADSVLRICIHRVIDLLYVCIAKVVAGDFIKIPSNLA